MLKLTVCWKTVKKEFIILQAYPLFPIFSRKKWALFQVEVNLESGAEVSTPIDMNEIAPDTYEMAQLTIPPL